MKVREQLAAGESGTTTDLEEIKAWAEKRGGKPTTVKGSHPSEKGVEQVGRLAAFDKLQMRYGPARTQEL
jgi:hypothetical protein